jgi:AMMECR1 domain-containing protein
VIVHVPGQTISTWPCTKALTTWRSGNSEPLSNSFVSICPSEAFSILDRKSRNATLRGCDGAVSSDIRSCIGAAWARRMNGTASGLARVVTAAAVKTRRVRRVVIEISCGCSLCTRFGGALPLSCDNAFTAAPSH